jgi:hypothetical protein
MAAIRPIHKKMLLLFAVYLLLSVAIVAFDQHGPVPDETCAICAMSSSLSAAIGQFGFIPEFQLTTERAYFTEGDHSRNFFAATPGISYRGPPLPNSFL